MNIFAHHALVYEILHDDFGTIPRDLDEIQISCMDDYVIESNLLFNY